MAANTSDGSDVARDRRRRLLARSRNDGDVPRQSRECVGGEVRRAPGREDAAVRARGPSDSLSRLPHRLVRDTARVDDSDVATLGLDVTVREKALADLVRIGLRDLAAEEPDREGRHGVRNSNPARAADPRLARRPS